MFDFYKEKGYSYTKDKSNLFDGFIYNVVYVNEFGDEYKVYTFDIELENDEEYSMNWILSACESDWNLRTGNH